MIKYVNNLTFLLVNRYLFELFSTHKFSTLFTPGEFLDHFKTAFAQLSSVSSNLIIDFITLLTIAIKITKQIEQLSGDFLLPAIVFILVKAK